MRSVTLDATTMLKKGRRQGLFLFLFLFFGGLSMIANTVDKLDAWTGS